MSSNGIDHARIYLDHNATSPVTEKTWKDLMGLAKLGAFNPSSPHASGRKTKIMLEESRMRLAKLLGVRSEELIFCSGATEANNMVIQGLAQSKHLKAEKLQVVSSHAEHPSVAETLELLKGRSLVDCDYTKISPSGSIDPDSLQNEITPQTDLVTLIWGHNEVGAINDLTTLVPLIRSRAPHCHIHVDGVQMLGRFDLSHVGKLGIDSCAFSGHKVAALKGVGFLYLKTPSKIGRFIAGGGQERARRAGTEAVESIISLGLVARDLLEFPPWANPTIQRAARSVLLAELKTMASAVVHGETQPERGLPNTVHFHLEGVAGDDVIINCDLAGLELSSGSACSSGSGRPSPSLLSMGYSDWVALNSVRVSFGANATAQDAYCLIQVLKRL